VNGRILYYNPHTGQGKLILKSQEKLDFSAELWEEFDVMPSAGKLVNCRIEKGELIGIGSIPFDEEVNAVEPKQVKRFFSEEIESEEGKVVKPKDSFYGQEPTFSVIQTIQNYFKPIETFIGEPPELINTKNQLDFFRVERFLMTAYNDLKNLDSTLHNHKEVKKILDEIRQLQKAYITLEGRLESPKLAFEMIFLRSQPEYLQFIRYNEQCLNRISLLSKMEESLFPDIQSKEEELKKLPKDSHEERDALEKELKTLRRYYVDTIHENAEIYEELSSMEDLKAIYTQKYLDHFLSELMKIGGKYMDTLRSVLNYRAFEFDQLIWSYAEKSRTIGEFLLSSHIEGEYSTLTFLRYYLKSLNEDKLSDEHKELVKLEAYLMSLEDDGGDQ
jgi:hypothetical protein